MQKIKIPPSLEDYEKNIWMQSSNYQSKVFCLCDLYIEMGRVIVRKRKSYRSLTSALQAYKDVIRNSEKMLGWIHQFSDSEWKNYYTKYYTEIPDRLIITPYFTEHMAQIELN